MQQPPLTPEQRRAAEEAAGLAGKTAAAADAKTLPGGVFLKGEVREVAGRRERERGRRARARESERQQTPLRWR